MRIISNTAALLTPEEGKKYGIVVLPVSVTMGRESFRDYIDIGSDDFAKRLREGEVAVSSQPAVGDVIDQMEGTDEEMVMLTVADGLSGEYMTAMGVRNDQPNRDRIHVINSGTLAGPLRYMAMKAAQMRDEGKSAEEIVAHIRACVKSSISFVIPADFLYLGKSGRVHQFTAKIGGALNLLPVLTQSEDHRRITLMRVKRTWKAAVGSIVNRLKELEIDENFLLNVAYADTRELAEQVKNQIREAFPHIKISVFQLSPSLITHGGPGCIVVQAVRK